MERGDIQILLCTAVVLCTCIYFWLIKKWNYWDERNVPNIKPTFTNNAVSRWITSGESDLWVQMKEYDKMAPHRYAGYFSAVSPMLSIRDPELIKQIFVKQSEDFSYKSPTFYSKTDTFTHFLVNLNGETWRWTRNRLSPAFTMGKLKQMLQFMTAAGSTLQKAVNNYLDKNGVVDVKTLAFYYLMDMVTACMFGLDGKTIENRDSEFMRNTRFMFGRNKLSFAYNNLLLNIPPQYRHYLSRRIMDKTSVDFFEQQLHETIEFIKRNNVNTATFAHYFMNLIAADECKGTSDEDEAQKWTFHLSHQNCLLIVFASIADPGSIAGFALYEIAKHKTVQDKLIKEIQQTLTKFNGEIAYDCLREMKYLHQVVLETMRMYPPTFIISRTCTNTCQLADTGLTVEKGVEVSIPIVAIHYDPQFYPNPNHFEPERFCEGWRTARHPFSFLPFGCGPRICIAERFVMLAIKTMIVSLVSKYEMSVPVENMLPFESDPKKFVSRVKYINLKLTERIGEIHQ